MSTLLGLTFSCRSALTAQFEVSTTDEQIVFDEVYHRLTTDSVLGDSDDAVSWGINVFRRCGAAMSDADVAALGPEFSAMLQQSPIVEFADVAVRKSRASGGTFDLEIAVNVTPKNPATNSIGEPLSFIFLLTPTTFLRVGDPDLTAGA